MSDQHDGQENAALAEVNHELTRSLQACHSLVDDYRLKLAANSHQVAANDEGDDGTAE